MTAMDVDTRTCIERPEMRQRDPDGPLRRERARQLWTPSLPQQVLERLEGLEPGSARLLWAVWCVPPRYRLSPGAWRQEARIATMVALRTRLRRLVQERLLYWRVVEGPGLAFDGQTWQPRSHGRATFWALRLTDAGEGRVRRALG
jgi:hypothetical protein